MSSSSEPEKYSIDQMMERLKARPAVENPQEGELVVREDGSQVVRVRKRKRRTNQPIKEQRQQIRRSRMIQVSASLIVLLFAAFGVGIAIVYANSAPFRDELIRKISRSTGATVDLQRFRMNPTHANADQLSLTWPAGNALANLTSSRVDADISPSSFLGGAMSGEEVSSPESFLTLRFPELGKPVRESPAEDVSSVGFKCYSSPKLHIILGDPAAPFARLDNTEVSFQTTNANDKAQLLLNRGDITIPGWPKFRLDRSTLEFRSQAVRVLGLRLWNEGDTQGILELTGTVSPNAVDRTSSLDVGLESFPLTGITGTEFGRLFSGKIDTISAAKSNLLMLKLESPPSSSLVVTFTGSLASSFTASGFPCLFGLSQTLGDDWFEHPEFEAGVSGVLRRTDGQIMLSDINLESKGRLTMRGTVIMTPDLKLSGTLELGVTEGVIVTARNPRIDAMFGPAKDGIRWISVKVSGTATTPADNFRQLYEASSSKPQTPKDSGTPSFEDLTAPK